MHTPAHYKGVIKILKAAQKREMEAHNEGWKARIRAQESMLKDALEAEEASKEDIE